MSTDQETKCYICDLQFDVKSKLDKHIQKLHSLDGKIYKCFICSKIFATAQHLQIHAVTHARNTDDVQVVYADIQKKSIKRRRSNDGILPNLPTFEDGISLDLSSAEPIEFEADDFDLELFHPAKRAKIDAQDVYPDVSLVQPQQSVFCSDVTPPTSPIATYTPWILETEATTNLMHEYQTVHCGDTMGAQHESMVTPPISPNLSFLEAPSWPDLPTFEEAASPDPSSSFDHLKTFTCDCSFSTNDEVDIKLHKLFDCEAISNTFTCPCSFSTNDEVDIKLHKLFNCNIQTSL